MKLKLDRPACTRRNLPFIHEYVGESVSTCLQHQSARCSPVTVVALGTWSRCADLRRTVHDVRVRAPVHSRPIHFIQRATHSRDGACDTHPPTPAFIDTDAKCPSLQMSGMMLEGKVSPESVIKPLPENERTVPTTSPVVAFSRSPLRCTLQDVRDQGQRRVSRPIEILNGIDGRAARDSPTCFDVFAGPKWLYGAQVSGLVQSTLR